MKQFGIDQRNSRLAAAPAAGVTVWALPYGYNMGKPIQDAAPDRVIQDFSALLAILARAE